MALTGNKIGHVMQHPTRQAITDSLRKRRKRYESRVWWVRTKVSGIAHIDLSQLNRPPGKGGVQRLEIVSAISYI